MHSAPLATAMNTDEEIRRVLAAQLMASNPDVQPKAAIAILNMALARVKEGKCVVFKKH